MRHSTRWSGAALTVVLSAGVATAAPQPPDLTPVPAATPKVAGIAAANTLSPELIETVIAQGAMPLDGAIAAIPYYGYDGNGPMLPTPGDVQSPTHNVEATKTEPDKNTYLVLDGQAGPDPSYDYGKHFLFQGHELGTQGYVTRINLDADVAHRVTLLATADRNGTPLPTIDGSTWNPFAQRLLLTTENKSVAGMFQATLDYPSIVDDLGGIVGKAGYEGVQNDADGNVWLVEDIGGSAGTLNPHAKQPNSFVYRFVPANVADLTAGGKLQALQVMSRTTGQPIAFTPGAADADITSPDVKDIHTYGVSLTTKWVTIHDTAVDGTAPFDANALAKTAKATPFKRPENGLFRPGSRFTEFFFDETGDTNALTEAGAAYGGFGSVLKLTQPDGPSAATGTLSLFYLGDVAHSGFDNVAFWSRTEIVFVEDAGDTLHKQRNAFDSAYKLDTRIDYGAANAPQPVRLLAQGRDPSATLDSLLGAAGGGFQNEGDNEITGFHVSDGDPRPSGILGARIPHALAGDWRVFYTQQHGDNRTYEILRAR